MWQMSVAICGESATFEVTKASKAIARSSTITFESFTFPPRTNTETRTNGNVATTSLNVKRIRSKLVFWRRGFEPVHSRQEISQRGGRYSVVDAGRAVATRARWWWGVATGARRWWTVAAGAVTPAF